jgi:hypothetical protein
MTTGQFAILMERLSDFEKRIRRLEWLIAMGTGMLVLTSFLVANGILRASV